MYYKNMFALGEVFCIFHQVTAVKWKIWIGQREQGEVSKATLALQKLMTEKQRVEQVDWQVGGDLGRRKVGCNMLTKLSYIMTQR